MRVVLRIPNALYCSCTFLGYNWDVFGPVKTCTFTQIHRLIYVCSIVDLVQGRMANSLVHSHWYRLFMTYRRQYYSRIEDHIYWRRHFDFEVRNVSNRGFTWKSNAKTLTSWPDECSLNMFSPEIGNLLCVLKIRTHYHRLFFVCYANVMFRKKSH